MQKDITQLVAIQKMLGRELTQPELDKVSKMTQIESLIWAKNRCNEEGRICGYELGGTFIKWVGG